MCDPLARLLDLRLRFRRNPEARAYVDRALVLVARALADETDPSVLEGEVDCLAEELDERFGAMRNASVQ